jgi:hypothetical protein
VSTDSAVVVAVITALSAVLVALIQRGRSENSRDHQVVIKRLDRLGDELARHFVWHDKQDKKKKK